MSDLLDKIKDKYEEYTDKQFPEVIIEIDDEGNVHFHHLAKDMEPMAEALGWKRESWWGSPCG